MLQIAQQLNIHTEAKNLSVAEFYNADEVFTTGTMGELTPVVSIDGRKIENQFSSHVRERIYAKFKELTVAEGERIK